jgi:hypothetical protein
LRHLANFSRGNSGHLFVEKSETRFLGAELDGFVRCGMSFSMNS